MASPTASEVVARLERAAWQDWIAIGRVSTAVVIDATEIVIPDGYVTRRKRGCRCMCHRASWEVLVEAAPRHKTCGQCRREAVRDSLWFRERTSRHYARLAYAEHRGDPLARIQRARRVPRRKRVAVDNDSLAGH